MNKNNFRCGIQVLQKRVKILSNYKIRNRDSQVIIDFNLNHVSCCLDLIIKELDKCLIYKRCNE